VRTKLKNYSLVSISPYVLHYAYTIPPAVTRQ
jgi:hypothetical protein